MTNFLPAFAHKLFSDTLEKVPNNYHSSIKNILNTITKRDLKQNRFKNLKGKMKLFRRFRKGDYRILFIYCKECYEMYNKIFECLNCDENLEKIIAFCVWKRKNVYKKLERRFGDLF